jgi:RNA polymerase sigma-70 factor (ECF subfamily)
MLADGSFIQQLRDQSESAILLMVDTYYAPITRYLTRLLGDQALANDLTQETFLSAYIALPRLRDDTNLSAWLYQIATNLARKQFRRQRLVRWLPFLDRGGSHNPEEQAVERTGVSRALARLPADYQTCLLLHTWAGLNCAEIGKVLGKSEAATKMLLMRARNRFKTYYEEEQ